MDIKKYEGAVSTDEFLRGLLQVSSTNTLGEIWERCVTCDKCFFEVECWTITQAIEALDPAVDVGCAAVMNILLGEKTVEDILK